MYTQLKSIVPKKECVWNAVIKYQETKRLSFGKIADFHRGYTEKGLCQTMF